MRGAVLSTVAVYGRAQERTPHDALRVAAYKASAISSPSERRVSISSGLPPIRCFSVTPSKNSIAMKAWR
jgi:hypothetical protein